MWSRRYHILAPLKDPDSGPKGTQKILCNDALESSFKEIKHMISAETLLRYSYLKLPFTVKTDAYDK